MVGSKTNIDRVKTFGEFLRRRRAELNLTQLEIAKAIGYKNAEYVGLLENPEKQLVNRKLHLDKLPRLAEILHIPLSDLAKLYMEENAPTLAMALFKDGSKEIRRGAFRLTHEEDLIAKLRALPFETRDPIIKMIDQLYKQTRKHDRPIQTA